MNDVITTEEFSLFYNVSLNTIKSFRASGMPFFKVDKREYNYIYREVEGWLSDCGNVYSKDRYLITPEELMREADITKGKYQWDLKKGKIPYYKLGSKRGITLYRFNYEEVENYINEMRNK